MAGDGKEQVSADQWSSSQRPWHDGERAPAPPEAAPTLSKEAEATGSGAAGPPAAAEVKVRRRTVSFNIGGEALLNPDSALSEAGTGAGDARRMEPVAEGGAERSGDFHEQRVVYNGDSQEGSSLSVTLAHGIASSEVMAVAEEVSSEIGGNANEAAEPVDERNRTVAVHRSGDGSGRRSFEFPLPLQADAEVGRFSLGMGPKSDSLQASLTLNLVNLAFTSAWTLTPYKRQPVDGVCQQHWRMSPGGRIAVESPP